MAHMLNKAQGKAQFPVVANAGLVRANVVNIALRGYIVRASCRMGRVGAVHPGAYNGHYPCPAECQARLAFSAKAQSWSKGRNLTGQGAGPAKFL